jgi:hypothetical protein
MLQGSPVAQGAPVAVDTQILALARICLVHPTIIILMRSASVELTLPATLIRDTGLHYQHTSGPSQLNL